jgi:hypothetical protein
MDGVDFDGRRQSWIIADAELKHAAESRRILISSRWVYALLKVFLLEEEGLLDDLMMQRLGPDIEVPMALFETKENVAVAKLAMAQGTWRGRLEVAFRLYGRRDARDEFLAGVLGLPRQRFGSSPLHE